MTDAAPCANLCFYASPNSFRTVGLRINYFINYLHSVIISPRGEVSWFMLFAKSAEAPHGATVITIRPIMISARYARASAKNWRKSGMMMTMIENT